MPQRDLLVSPWSPKVVLPQSAVRPSHTLSSSSSSSSSAAAAAAAVVQFRSGQVESDSTRPDLLSWSQGNFPCRLPTSGFIVAEWREASGHPPFSLPSSLPASHSSLPPSPSAFSLYFCPLHFFSSSPSSSTIQYPCLILT